MNENNTHQNETNSINEYEIVLKTQYETATHTRHNVKIKVITDQDLIKMWSSCKILTFESICYADAQYGETAYLAKTAMQRKAFAVLSDNIAYITKNVYN